MPKTQTIEKRKSTYEDYLKMPDDERYELIEGELIMTLHLCHIINGSKIAFEKEILCQLLNPQNLS